MRLEPCPFCGVPLYTRPSVNQVGRCDTPGCWMNARMLAVVLDDPGQVEGWNRRAASPLLEPARALLAAFGGDIPDWLRAEAQALEDAINRATGEP